MPLVCRDGEFRNKADTRNSQSIGDVPLTPQCSIEAVHRHGHHAAKHRKGDQCGRDDQGRIDGIRLRRTRRGCENARLKRCEFILAGRFLLATAKFVDLLRSGGDATFQSGQLHQVVRRRLAAL